MTFRSKVVYRGFELFTLKVKLCNTHIKQGIDICFVKKKSRKSFKRVTVFIRKIIAFTIVESIENYSSYFCYYGAFADFCMYFWSQCPLDKVLTTTKLCKIK